jgi:uncharacterized protein (DUF952 family)
VTRIYKILPAGEWREALALGRFEGSAIDHADGYIHFSTAAQSAETARKYFSGRAGLMILGVEGEQLGVTLKWEPSRGGDLFPHLYGPLPVGAVDEARDLPLDETGLPILGDLRP